MHLEFFTAFNKGDIVFSELYGTGVVTAVSVRFLLLPDDDREEDISYFVSFAKEELIVAEAELRPQTVTDVQQSTLSGS